MGFSEYEGFMRIHDSDMSLHLLYLDEPIESSLEENLMDPRHTICLSEEEGKRGLEIRRKSWVDIGLEIGWPETRARVIDRDDIFFSVEREPYSDVLTLPEKCGEVRYPSMFYPYRRFRCEGTQYDECPTLDIVSYDGSLCRIRNTRYTIDDDMMIIGDLNMDSERSEKVDETDHMWLYRSELDGCTMWAKCRHHEDILCRCDGKIPSDCDIFPMISSLECYILTFTHILISIERKCLQVFIDRTFSDIAPSWIGDLESAESSQEWGEEKYTNSDFLDLFAIEFPDTHVSCVECECSFFIKSNYYPERLDDREKGEDISDTRNIMERKVIEKESTRYEGKGGIFRSWDRYRTGERLRSVDFEHRGMASTKLFYRFFSELQ